jgi:hypothetical protein
MPAYGEGESVHWQNLDLITRGGQRLSRGEVDAAVELAVKDGLLVAADHYDVAPAHLFDMWRRQRQQRDPSWRPWRPTDRHAFSLQAMRAARSKPKP